VTAATGTTVAGFLLGEHALREAGFPAIRVVGVQVYPGAMRRSVRWLLYWTARHLRLQALVPDKRIEIVSTELCGGFGCFPKALAERCRQVGADTGLDLDPIFGGKTWTAMEGFITREAPPDESVLYWHCGFTPEWSKLGRVTMGDRRPW
jgi:1-aminocyclopropane-1-carboxylate deaminase/D-cysteine desulfhydrase-like pyridoxal-dependent ACC family enzyme